MNIWVFLWWTCKNDGFASLVGFSVDSFLGVKYDLILVLTDLRIFAPSFVQKCLGARGSGLFRKKCGKIFYSYGIAWLLLASLKACDWSGHIFGASANRRSLKKRVCHSLPLFVVSMIYQICGIRVAIACGIVADKSLGWHSWTSSYCTLFFFGYYHEKISGTDMRADGGLNAFNTICQYFRYTDYFDAISNTVSNLSSPLLALPPPIRTQSLASSVIVGDGGGGRTHLLLALVIWPRPRIPFETAHRSYS